MELVLFVSQFIRGGNHFWIGDKGKVSRDGRILFLIPQPLCFFLEEIFNVLFCRTEGVLGGWNNTLLFSLIISIKNSKRGRSRNKSLRSV